MLHMSILPVHQQFRCAAQQGPKSWGFADVGRTDVLPYHTNSCVKHPPTAAAHLLPLLCATACQHPRSAWPVLHHLLSFRSTSSHPVSCLPCSRLLANLKYVVVDEGHAYKGEPVEGLHVERGFCKTTGVAWSGRTQPLARAMRGAPCTRARLPARRPDPCACRRVWLPRRAGAAPPAPPLRARLSLAGVVEGQWVWWMGRCGLNALKRYSGWVDDGLGAVPLAPPLRPHPSFAGAARRGRRRLVCTGEGFLSELDKALQQRVGPTHPRLTLSPPLVQPTFAVTTATVANPAEHACELLGVPEVQGATSGGSCQGKPHFRGILPAARERAVGHAGDAMMVCRQQLQQEQVAS